ncbi:flagellar hook-basal body complex protein FliE [Microcella daejeonensis]|uniref:flagellar hook-basal body complex protein FliE n=1 Tax=Microcella daejeonensis TaxID=2994971 RepID=UPI00226EE43C|nr:flagellar hook-basal body complex protein FliE [Microcella daejeonensis]WAB83891.1 flagellar hook-basal body complex protein FliE [Microcella daejeonensis]
MPIAPLSPLGGITPPEPAVAAIGAPPAADGGSGFAGQLAGAIDEAQRLGAESNSLALAAVTGDLTDLHAATIASSRASLTLEVMTTMRNKGIEAFNDVMRMQA